MSQGLKRKHEGLANYLHSIGAPGGVTAGGGLQPRQPVAPGSSIPGGFRPIPTSSQRPKPTNATIVYSRTAVADTRKLGRIGKFFKEGDVVFTQRIAPPLRDPMGQNVKVTSVQLLNQDLKDFGPMDAEEYAQFFQSRDGAFKWAPDGVVNNLDGADPENQFKDFALANVAIQGFVRFSTLPFGDETRGHNFPHLFTQKGARNGDRVFLSLVSRPAAGAAGEAGQEGVRVPVLPRVARHVGQDQPEHDREGVAHRARRGRQPVQEHDHRVRGRGVHRHGARAARVGPRVRLAVVVVEPKVAAGHVRGGPWWSLVVCGVGGTCAWHQNYIT